MCPCAGTGGLSASGAVDPTDERQAEEQAEDAPPQAEPKVAAVTDPDHPDASPLNGVIPPPAKRWKPGQSGNPSGGTKRRNVIDEMARLLAEGDYVKTPDGRSIVFDFQSLARQILIKSHTDPRFLAILMGYMHGKPKETIEHSVSTETIMGQYERWAEVEERDKPVELEAGEEGE